MTARVSPVGPAPTTATSTSSVRDRSVVPLVCVACSFPFIASQLLFRSPAGWVGDSPASTQSYLELPSIGWQLFTLGSPRSDSSAFLSSLDTYDTRLLTEPLSKGVSILSIAHYCRVLRPG